jgi:hypothetical protein
MNTYFQMAEMRLHARASHRMAPNSRAGMNGMRGGAAIEAVHKNERASEQASKQASNQAIKHQTKKGTRSNNNPIPIPIPMGCWSTGLLV